MVSNEKKKKIFDKINRYHETELETTKLWCIINLNKKILQ